RSGNRVLTFTHDGASGANGYSYAPEFELSFPQVDSWALLFDFNCDNVPDLFTHATLGIRVFRGHYDACGALAFTLYKPLLLFEFLGTAQNLLVTGNDIPAFTDVNNDGDVDVLTFDPNGGYMWYYENVSQENGWGCDSLFFNRVDQCWGDFFEGASVNCKDLDAACPFLMPPYGGGMSKRSNGPLRHTGSTTLAFDNTGDGLKELLIGDVSFKGLGYLVNDGTLADAHIGSQDCAFPSYDVPAVVPYFPAAFRVDADHDGVKDLIVSPNASEGSNTLACAHWYRNSGANDAGVFTFQTDSFLVVDMIDLGEGSAPVFFDFDADGLLDLLVSNVNYYDTTSFIATFKNYGTPTSPAFRLTKRNYASMASLNKLALRPTFGDLDGDGDPDMICGNEDGALLYFVNTAVPGNPPQFILNTPNYFGIDVGSYSVPQLYDANGDGLLDLIIGKVNGKISFYRNQGTAANADFSTLTSATFGNISVNPTALDGHSYPLMTTLPGYAEPVLLVGNKQGELHLYDNIAGNLDGTFNLVTAYYSNIHTGKRSTVAAADINGDGLVELAIGHYRGGITIYDTMSNAVFNPCVGVQNIRDPEQMLSVFPSPANGLVQLQSEAVLLDDALVETYDAVGRKLTLHVQRLDERSLVMDASELPDGVYTTRVAGRTGVSICRWVKAQ
ncbi:MAG TPA: hypothetical protein VEY71_07925, partial [Chitinophagales bacterium]|nr:hypothetical protein [Chitinophagales bacterium]